MTLKYHIETSRVGVVRAKPIIFIKNDLSYSAGRGTRSRVRPRDISASVCGFFFRRSRETVTLLVQTPFCHHDSSPAATIKQVPSTPALVSADSERSITETEVFVSPGLSVHKQYRFTGYIYTLHACSTTLLFFPGFFSCVRV